MASSSTPFQGYDHFTFEFNTLLSVYPPPFIYIQDSEALPTSLRVIDALLRDLSAMMPPTTPHVSSTSKIYSATVDSISCFTPKLLYESIINTLVGWEPKWEEGCGNWVPENEVRWNDSMDTFLHGLRAAHAHLCKENGIQVTNGKGETKEPAFDNVRFVIVIERTERMNESLHDLLVPLTRLAELAGLDLSVVFVSQVSWEEIRPPFGASPDPYYIDIRGLSKENIVEGLVNNFGTISESSSLSLTPYHPSLITLYKHFATVLCDVCYPFTHNPRDLQYIAAARWPGFCKPVLDQYTRMEKRNTDHDDASDTEMDITAEEDDVPKFVPPNDDTRMRLSRLFNSTLTSAIESLLPRLFNAIDWAHAHTPPDNLLLMSRGFTLQQQASSMTSESGLTTLPRMLKFILLACFMASTNPPKSDIRMFGRGLDERKHRRRRVNKGPTKVKGGGPSKIPRRLLGPTTFSLDRMIAILGALLEENDADTRLQSPKKMFKIPGEYTDMEIGRVGVFSGVIELTSMCLLHRTTPPDRLDGPPQFKCAISYDTALSLAKQLDVALNDLLWDPV